MDIICDCCGRKEVRVNRSKNRSRSTYCKLCAKAGCARHNHGDHCKLNCGMTVTELIRSKSYEILKLDSLKNYYYQFKKLSNWECGGCRHNYKVCSDCYRCSICHPGGCCCYSLTFKVEAYCRNLVIESILPKDLGKIVMKYLYRYYR